MNFNRNNYLPNPAERYFNADGFGENFAYDGSEIYSAMGNDFAADGAMESDMGMNSLNTSVNTYTLIANNTTGATVAANFFGPNKYSYLGSSSVYGNTGLSLYISELGTTIASYAQFLSEINQTPKQCNTWRITATSTNSSSITTQVQSTVYTLSKTQANGVLGSYPVSPFKYVNGMLFNENIIDIPVPFMLNSDTYLSVNVLAYTQLTMILFIGQSADLSNVLSRRAIQSSTNSPVPLLNSQKVIVAR
ncbi:MAG: hypothetical protein EXR21_09125 [Flavobacteriaceae bacterium]|nr:hypothetical protein [Flavobacteriaceae bacterium]